MKIESIKIICVENLLSKMNIKLDKDKEKILTQIIKFAIVGGTATILDWIIYYIAYKF